MAGVVLVLCGREGAFAQGATVNEFTPQYVALAEYQSACLMPIGSVEGTMAKIEALGWQKTTERDYRDMTLPDDVLRRAKVKEAYLRDDNNGLRGLGVGKAQFKSRPSVYCHMVFFGSASDRDQLLEEFQSLYPGPIEKTEKKRETRYMTSSVDGNSAAYFQAIDFGLENEVWGYFALSVIHREKK